jgi:hypothetical protein
MKTNQIVKLSVVESASYYYYYYYLSENRASGKF